MENQKFVALTQEELMVTTGGGYEFAVWYLPKPLPSSGPKLDLTTHLSRYYISSRP